MKILILLVVVFCVLVWFSFSHADWEIENGSCQPFTRGCYLWHVHSVLFPGLVVMGVTTMLYLIVKQW